MLFGLFRIAALGRLRHPLLTVSTVAFLPIVLKNATSTMDFIPALAVLVWSYAFALEKRWMLSALLIGLACGFRPSSGLFLVPVVLHALSETRNLRTILGMVAAAAVVGLISYSPVLLEYGYRTPFMSTRPGFGIRLLSGGYNLLRLFGIAQSLALAILFLHLLRSKRATLRAMFHEPEVRFHSTNIVAWLALFSLLPAEPEYLLPLVPSVAFLLDRLLSRRALLVTCIAMLSYHVFQADALGGESGRRRLHFSIQPGYTIQDVQDRLFKLSTRRAASESRFDEPTVLMLGYEWIPVLNDSWQYERGSGMYRQKGGNLFLAPRILDEGRLQELTAGGFRIVLWRHAKWEYFRTGAAHLLRYMDVIGDLGSLFGAPVSGKALTQR
jgi:hypothetical protein